VFAVILILNIVCCCSERYKNYWQGKKGDGCCIVSLLLFQCSMDISSKRLDHEELLILPFQRCNKYDDNRQILFVLIILDPHTGNRWIFSIWVSPPKYQPPLDV